MGVPSKMRVALVGLVLLAACGEAQSDSPQKLPVRTLQVGNETVAAQIADDDAERETGLMFVKSMPENAGMLFVWPEARERNFWMKNTYIPLDLLYVNKGKVISVISWAKPFDETALPSNGPADMVLEMNGGWASKHGVGIGDAVVQK